MPTKLAKQVFREVERLGFEQVWANGKGFPCYVHPADPQQTEVSINPSINNESGARLKIRECQKIAGELPRIEKRKGENVRERHAAERESAKRRLEWAEQKRARLMTEKADAEHIRRIDELIELRRNQLLAIHAEMTETPAGSQHVGRGRVEHVGGATPL